MHSLSFVLTTLLLVPMLAFAGILKRPDFIKTAAESAKMVFADEESHESHVTFIIGTETSEQELSERSPEETLQRISTAVERMDANGDKLIQFKELFAWINDTAQKLDQEDLHRKFVLSDKDESGAISWQEYAKAAFPMMGAENMLAKLKQKEDSNKFMEQERDLFNLVDRDSSGDLNETEFHVFYHPAEFEDSLNFVIQRTFLKDQNGDGKLSFKEYVSGDGRSSNIFYERHESEKFRNELDKSGDGLVSRWELKSYLELPLSKTVQHEVSKLIKCADNNLDGMLSVEEILQHYQPFQHSHLISTRDEL